MSFAKPSLVKYAAASKPGSYFDKFLQDRVAVRFLLANIGGAVILGTVTSLRSSGDAFDYSYEVVLLLLGLLVYFQLHAQKPKSKAKALKVTRERRPSPRERPEKREECAPERKRQPRQTPSFNAVGWEAEIGEFLQQVSLTSSSETVLQALVQATREGVQHIVPEAKITAFTSVSLVNNCDIGTLEAAISIELEPALLAERMEAFGMKKMSQRPKNDLQVMDRKSAIGMPSDDLAKLTLRMLTRDLSRGSFFLYHHCAYKEREPKVVLKVPAFRGISDRDIFVTFTVNSPTPVRAAKFDQQLELFDHKARDLCLLVRRWARDRGIAYAPKGHLQPYAWTCLVGYYLQRRYGDFWNHEARARGNEAEETAGTMFKEFLGFYANFDWRAGVISLRLGRQVVGPESPLGGLDGGVVSIEDPFEPARNVAETMTSLGFQRLLEEFTRARNILGMDNEGSVRLKDLLEAWNPPKEDTP